MAPRNRLGAGRCPMRPQLQPRRFRQHGRALCPARVNAVVSLLGGFTGLIPSGLAAAACAAGTCLATFPTTDDAIAGDANCDGRVDGADLALVADRLGEPALPIRSHGDLNRDGSVDELDLAIVEDAQGATQMPLPPAAAVALVGSDGLPPASGAVESLGEVFDDDGQGEPVRVFRDRPLVDATLWKPEGVPSLIPALTTNWRSDGVTLEIRYSNSGSEAANPAAVRIPVFDRSVQPNLRSMREAGKLIAPDYNDAGNFSGPMLGYPGSLYSPAIVVEQPAAGHTVGIAVRYPVLDYEQDVFLKASDLAADDGMLITFHANPDNNGKYRPEIDIAPGESRRFLILIRVHETPAYPAGHPGDWLRTLRSYRRFFRCEYGGVRYMRRVEQVTAVNLAIGFKLSEANPYGFLKEATHRPDEFGFGPWRAELDARAALGWERVMVREPTGLYLLHPGNNFPPQFTSEWSVILAGVQPPHDPSLGPLSDYATDTGGRLGLWWGRSSQIASQWDPAVLDLLDHANPDHWAFRDNELAGALAVNATEIGLDAFGAAGRWTSFRTLVRDQQVYPGLHFITEAMHPDFVHTMAPNYLSMSQSPADHDGELYKFSDGVPIIDFLLPGHESWGQLEARHIKEALGLPQGAGLSAEQARPFVEQVAAAGMVPVFFGENLPPELAASNFDAEATWLTAVPSDLQEPLFADGFEVD